MSKGSEKDSGVRWLDDLDNNDVASIGGKNASLGEMIGSLKEQEIRVPDQKCKLNLE